MQTEDEIRRAAQREKNRKRRIRERNAGTVRCRQGHRLPPGVTGIGCPKCGRVWLSDTSYTEQMLALDDLRERAPNVMERDAIRAQMNALRDAYDRQDNDKLMRIQQRSFRGGGRPKCADVAERNRKIVADLASGHPIEEVAARYDVAVKTAYQVRGSARYVPQKQQTG